MIIPKLQAAGGSRTNQQILLGYWLGYPKRLQGREDIIEANLSIFTSDDFNQTADQELDQAAIAREVNRSKTEITAHGGNFVVWRQYVTVDIDNGIVTGYAYDSLVTLRNLRKDQPRLVENIRIVILERESQAQNRTYAYPYPDNDRPESYVFPQNFTDSLNRLDETRSEQAYQAAA